MAGRKSSEVKFAVAAVIAGRYPNPAEAARNIGVSPSSIHRDADYKAWKEKQKEKAAQ